MHYPSFIFALSLCCVIHPVAAEGADENELAELVITATGSAIDRFDTSLPMNLIGADDLTGRAVVSMAEVFRDEPGVDAVTAGPGSVHPVIRGLHGERVLVLVNGVRLSEQRPGGNHAFSLDPAQIERVEVVRGPASVLYGSDAIGGVVNFIPKGADEETGDEARFSGETGLGYLSNGEGWTGNGHLRFGEGRFNGYIGGVWRDTGNIENKNGEVANSFYEGYTLWAGGNYIGDGWKTSIDYSFMKADIGIPGPAAFADDYFKGEQHQKFVWSLEAENLSPMVERMSVDFGWQRHNRHRYRRKVNQIPAALIGDLEININLDIDTYTLKPQVIITPNENHTITTGLDFFYEDASSGRTLRDSGSTWVNPVYDDMPVIPDSTRIGIGVFIQDEISLGDRWSLTPGFRADWIKSETDGYPGHAIASKRSSENSELSGNLGLLYKATDEINLYANVGRAFRSPTLLELYFYGPHDVANDIGNPDLEAETSWNFDVGMKVRTGKIEAMASVFYNKVNNYIAREQLTSGDYMYKNYADVSLWGAEAGLDYDLGAGFSAFASVSYVRGKNDDEGDLSSIPPLKARYGVRYERSFGNDHKFWAELSGLSVSNQDKTGRNETQTNGYTIGNFRAGVDFSETWSVVAAVDNFTDKLYQDHLSSSWQAFGINDQPGRCVKLMLKAKF